MRTTKPIATMSQSEYLGLCEDYAGICLACGAIADSGVEPDAERYECEDCGRNRVYGLEQALIMGRLEITE